MLHGPRGNGKTALIGWLENEATERLNLRQIKARFVSDPTAVAENLLGSHQDESLEETMHGLIGGGVPGILRGEDTRKLTRRQTVSLSLDDAMKRSANEKPLLMIMDEAHTADPAGMGVFLNAFQDSARIAPMRLLLAGTANVRDVLSAADATFADRMGKLPIGLPTSGAGRAAIAEPFASHGIDSDDEVAERLSAWADHYPYFLQLVGETAWTEAAYFGRLMRVAGEAAIERARVPRDEYHFQRFKELQGASLTAFATDIDRNVQAGKIGFMKTSSKRSPRLHCGKGWNAAVDFVVQKGFLWRAEAEREYQPGIPSLMRYAHSRTGNRPQDRTANAAAKLKLNGYRYLIVDRRGAPNVCFAENVSRPENAVSREVVFTRSRHIFGRASPTV